MDTKELTITRAQASRAAIERLYIEMRHLFNQGTYRRLGDTGEVLTEALLTLRPEIYGSMGDLEKVELDGLVYVVDRLPRGIEECRFVKLISEEGYRDAGFKTIVPAKRRRNCYRIDEDHMYIEVTRGRSEIYDILTHLTFMYIEAEKIRLHALDEEGKPTVAWQKLEDIVKRRMLVTDKNRDQAFTYLSMILGRTLAETRYAYFRLSENKETNNGMFHVVYWLGKVAMERADSELFREISFTPTLRERIGHHIYGEKWAKNIKQFLLEKQLLSRPMHIISANLHSMMNCLYAHAALRKTFDDELSLEDVALLLSKLDNSHLRKQVREFAEEHGMYTLEDHSGTNITVQIFDTSRLNCYDLSPEIQFEDRYVNDHKPVLIVMDYAFGEQAYETLDELLKPTKVGNQHHQMPISSISIMGKAGVLHGGKGDIMIPSAHVFEGTADNYPIDNALSVEQFDGYEGNVYYGPMITVLGTSLQNREVLSYFHNSSWKAIGLEMEGAHYQKAIQAESLIRKSILPEIKIRYAYYASDNPLITGSTLASGSLGEAGVRPTYLISKKILGDILTPDQEYAKQVKSP